MGFSQSLRESWRYCYKCKSLKGFGLLILQFLCLYNALLNWKYSGIFQKQTQRFASCTCFYKTTSKRFAFATQREVFGACCFVSCCCFFALCAGYQKTTTKRLAFTTRCEVFGCQLFVSCCKHFASRACYETFATQRLATCTKHLPSCTKLFRNKQHARALLI